MISQQSARKTLGKNFEKLTEEEIESLLNQLYGLADIVTDLVLQGSNKPPKVIEKNNEDCQNKTNSI